MLPIYVASLAAIFMIAILAPLYTWEKKAKLATLSVIIVTDTLLAGAATLVITQYPGILWILGLVPTAILMFCQAIALLAD